MIVFIAVATLSFAACVQVNEAITDRNLICEATPDDLCLRIADFAVSPAANIDPEVGEAALKAIKVEPTQCKQAGRMRGATRCWRVEAGNPVDDSITNGYGTWVFERPDGTLGLAN